MEMPDYLSDYKPSDTVPFELWKRATHTASGDCGNPGYFSDAIHLNIKPAKKGDAYIDHLNKRLTGIETRMRALRSERAKIQHELKRATK